MEVAVTFGNLQYESVHMYHLGICKKKISFDSLRMLSFKMSSVVNIAVPFSV